MKARVIRLMGVLLVMASLIAVTPVSCSASPRWVHRLRDEVEQMAVEQVENYSEILKYNAWRSNMERLGYRSARKAREYYQQNYPVYRVDIGGMNSYGNPYVVNSFYVDWMPNQYEEGLMSVIINCAQSGVTYYAVSQQQRDDLIAVARRIGYHGQFQGRSMRFWY